MLGQVAGGQALKSYLLGNFREVLLLIKSFTFAFKNCVLDMVTFSRVFQLSSYWMVPGSS